MLLADHVTRSIVLDNDRATAMARTSSNGPVPTENSPALIAAPNRAEQESVRTIRCSSQPGDHGAQQLVEIDNRAGHQRAQHRELTLFDH
jgi:hypothetical protein